ncbi:MAG: carbohydrate porin [Deltaproteobacteria bacterium]|nr:carbohydrate porin [Deltaproteobacteria bacterium]
MKSIRRGNPLWLPALALFFLTSILPLQSFAGTEEEIKVLKERVDAMEGQHTEFRKSIAEELDFLRRDMDMVDYRTARIKALDQKVGAFTLGGDLSFFLQGFSVDGEGKTDGSYSGDLFLTIPVGPYGNVYLRGDIGEGEGIAGGLPPTFSGPNADLEFNEPKFTLAEAWYWTSFPIPDLRDQRLELTIGKIDPTGIFDANAVANSETNQFIADIFVNNLAIEFAGDENGYGPGVALGYRFTSIYTTGLEVIGRLGLFEGDIEGEGTFKRVFDRPFVIGELDIKTSYYGLGGNYRIYGWINQNSHTKWDGSDDDAANKGFGLSIDQRVSNDVTLFARYGLQDEDVSNFGQVITIGGQVIGNSWRRGNDAIGIAYGLSKTSGKYEDVSLATNGYEAKGDEHYIEAYYKYWANANLTISPDLQYVVNPGGDEEKDAVLIYAARMQLTF